MIILQCITPGGIDYARLLAVNRDIFKKDVTLAAATNRGAVLPDLHPFASLRSLLDNKIGRP